MNQLSRLSRDLFSDIFKDLSFQRQLSKPLYDLSIPESINIDVSEKADSFEIQADIPGVKKEDINVSIDGRRLEISVEAKQEKEEKKDEKVILSERYFGYVSRSVILPAEVDQSQAQAHYENGVLSLTLPKASGSTANRITIN